MPGEPNSLILEHLRAIRATLEIQGEHLQRIDARLSVIEQTLGQMYALSGSDTA